MINFLSNSNPVEKKALPGAYKMTLRPGGGFSRKTVWENCKRQNATATFTATTASLANCGLRNGSKESESHKWPQRMLHHNLPLCAAFTEIQTKCFTPWSSLQQLCCSSSSAALESRTSFRLVGMSHKRPQSPFWRSIYLSITFIGSHRFVVVLLQELFAYSVFQEQQVHIGWG